MSAIRQQQVASLIKRALSDIFIKEGRNIYSNAFVTITQVRLTPDLSVARIYLSVYNIQDKEDVVTMITENEHGLRRLLGNQIRNKVRHIPTLEFYLDDTLDEVYKMDQLLDSLDIQPEREDSDEEE
ncbi:MAG: 30S ribosome-binding factor RbfA [Chitinophagales bacterium]